MRRNQCIPGRRLAFCDGISAEASGPGPSNQPSSQPSASPGPGALHERKQQRRNSSIDHTVRGASIDHTVTVRRPGACYALHASFLTPRKQVISPSRSSERLDHILSISFEQPPGPRPGPTPLCLSLPTLPWSCPSVWRAPQASLWPPGIHDPMNLAVTLRV